jgi:type II secretory pathway pseudopilin PulG
MKTGRSFHPSRQRGVSLIVTLMIVVLLSLLGLYGAGVLVLDTRSAANDYRAREAMAAAESGTEQGLNLVSVNHKRVTADGLDLNDDGAVGTGEPAWATCGTEDWCKAIRSGDRANWQYMTVTALASQPTAGDFTVHLLTPVPDADPDKVNGSLLVYNVVAIGRSADTTSTATLKQGGYFYPTLLASVNTPLAADGNVSLSGNYSIITNSDRSNDGSNVPVTAWSNGTFAPAGSFTSCHVGDFDGSACQPADALSKAGVVGEDLVTDPNFPPDLFDFLFGVPEADYLAIKEQAEVVADCSGIGPSSSGLIWVTGDCNPPGNVGTAEDPVLLVVQGDTTLNAGSQFYGVLFLFDPAGGASSLIANGNAHLHGAVFAQDGLNLNLSGGFVLEYDREVLENLESSPSARALTRIPGAWSDVQE